MYKLWLVQFFLLIGLVLQAQTPGSIITELKTINTSLVNEPSSADKGRLISNRGMNIFLANKAGYYLAESNNLSLYKNAALYNSAEGLITVNHNLYEPKGIDARVSSISSVGVRANVADAFSAASSGRQYNNQLGFNWKQTWIAKGNTYYDNNADVSANQRKRMDALRAAILHTLEREITAKAEAFEAGLKTIDTALEIPGQNGETAKNTMRTQFYADLQQEYEFKFASLQSETLINTLNYKYVTTNWTSINVYIPLLLQKFTITPSLSGSFTDKHAYPLQVTLSHTRFFESSHYGKLMLTLGTGVYWNNSKDGYGLDKTTYADYKNRGGTDTLRAAQLEAGGIYMGNYESFFTPLIKGQVVWLPPDWHFGISLSLEQNLGRYSPLNGRIGIPIVLINKQADPSINFEFQVRFFDIGGKINADRLTTGKTSIGISIGVPFSRIAY